jgi:LCP family protein required for cell wall assembly
MVVLAILSAVVVIASITGAGLQYMTSKLGDNIKIAGFDTSGDVDRPAGFLVDPVTNSYRATNIVLMGSDSRTGPGDDKYGDPTVNSNARSDTTILLHLSADRTWATAVSIPRDTWITLPTCRRDGSDQVVGGYESKFNSAYEMAGPGCTAKAVEQMTGLQVDHFVVLDFAGFTNVIDSLGGVEMCLTQAVNDKDSKLVLPAGTSLLNGEQSLGFVRARKTLSDGSDLARIKRQQAFLSSMIRTATSSQLLLNPVKLFGVLDSATQSITTDPQLGDINNLRDFALSAQTLSPENIGFLTVPWLPRGDGENVVIDQEKAAALWASMKSDTQYIAPKSAKAPELPVAPSDVSVRVLNGSGIAGKGGAVADALSQMGFAVQIIDDAPTADYATSVVQYATGDDAIAKAVAYAMKGTASPEGATLQESAGLDMLTIIVGADQTSVDSIKVRADAVDPITAPTTADKVTCS